jgi:hypothetical protein
MLLHHTQGSQAESFKKDIQVMLLFCSEPFVGLSSLMVKASVFTMAAGIHVVWVQ